MKECQCHRKFYQKLEVEAFYKKLSLRNENLWMYLVQTRHLKGPYADNFPLVQRKSNTSFYNINKGHKLTRNK